MKTIDIVIGVLKEVELFYQAEAQTQTATQQETYYSRKGFLKRKQRKFKRFRQNQPEENYALKRLAIGTFSEFYGNAAGFDDLSEMLADDESRRVLEWYIRYRIAYGFLGERAACLAAPPVDQEIYSGLLRQLKATARDGIYKVDSFRIRTLIPVAIVDAWFIDQYRIAGIVEPGEGNVVIDAGAFNGETALWFSGQVGASGKVFAFEPFPENFAILAENLKSNNTENILPAAVGLGAANSRVSMMGIAAGAVVVDDADGDIELVKLDTYVATNAIDRVDFIKMDIEGSELAALKGAAGVIRKWRPALAISAYHRKDDLIELPRFIHSLVAEYRFYLRHSSPHMNETVLFATCG